MPTAVGSAATFAASISAVLPYFSAFRLLTSATIISTRAWATLATLLIHLLLKSHRPARMNQVPVVLDDDRQLRRPVAENPLGPASRNRFMEADFHQVVGSPVLVFQSDEVVQQDSLDDTASQDVNGLRRPAFHAAV